MKFTLRIPEKLVDFEVDDATLATARNESKTYEADRIYEAARTQVEVFLVDDYEFEVYGQDGQQVDLDPEGYYSDEGQPMTIASIEGFFDSPLPVRGPGGDVK